VLDGVLISRVGRLNVVTDERDLWSHREPWSHNAHYHRVIRAVVPPGCERALDVGCGQGALTRRLRQVVPEVIGLDRDERSIEIARAHPRAQGITYVLGDLLGLDARQPDPPLLSAELLAMPDGAGPLRPGSLDLVTAVASVHHMDTEAALVRMAELLRPGGVLVVVGLARESSLAGLFLNIPAFFGHRAHLVASAWVRRGEPRRTQAYQSPIVWPPPLTYRQVRQLAERVLPGARFRRRLYWRYSLAWTKPA
jgi:SAM-dependent methyltransferase